MEFRGRYFEEFVIGEEIESAPRAITEADIMTFAELSGDTNPLHVDPEYARTTVFGERIAHGLLGLSVASGLAWQTGLMEGTAIAFIGLDWKFRAPIRIGDTIRVRMAATQKKDAPSGRGLCDHLRHRAESAGGSGSEGDVDRFGSLPTPRASGTVADR
ncbi:MAG: MaoC/PaaZ C-terminal domain-containing protein [Anaerolineae bacterium]